jgi:hypothetical protein
MREKSRDTPDRRIDACLRKLSGHQTDPHGTGHSAGCSGVGSHRKGLYQPVEMTLGSRNKPWLEESSQGDNTTCNKNNFKF